jgi:TetR/AcrR family transcriptional regulator, transcriptional repressor for nem operon
VARTVDKQAHDVKRGEILNAALRLISAKGYEAMAVQDLLDSLGISKGAFYHYFPTKGALLEALVEHLCHGAENVLTPIAGDRNLPAPETFSRFFAALARYKADQRVFIFGMWRAWFSDQNAIVRDKMRAAFAVRLSPMIADIIRHGCEEGSFSVTAPDQTARVVLGLTQDVADALARLLLSDGNAPRVAGQMAQMVASATEAVERVLGAPPGSLRLIEPSGLDVWLPPPQGDQA